MDVVQPYLDGALAFLTKGYNQVNGPQGLLIALLAVVLMRAWSQLLPITAGAAAAYAVVDAVRPILLQGGALKLPPVTDPAYWSQFAALYVGLMVIVAMFFAAKKVLFMRGGGAPAHGGKAKAKAH